VVVVEDGVGTLVVLEPATLVEVVSGCVTVTVVEVVAGLVDVVDVLVAGGAVLVVVGLDVVVDVLAGAVVLVDVVDVVVVQGSPSSQQEVPAASSWQFAEQQSPSLRLPSSHCSPRSTVPFPHANSYAPMSQAAPCGRATPRWSAPEQAPAASMAGLPARSARVGVSPPLSASGPSIGSSPKRSPLDPTTQQPDTDSIRLPDDESLPEQSGASPPASELRARMEDEMVRIAGV
jgi:hypothetical protein